MFDSKKLPVVTWILTLALLACLAGDQPASADDSKSPPAEVSSIDIPNAKMPNPGVLVGGQPTPEQLEEAARQGYRTVLSLRTEGEVPWDEPAKVAALGMRYVAIPVAGADGLSEDTARAVAEVLKDSENLPVMVHCGSGNRVGAIFSLMAFHLDGADPEKALAQGFEAGLTSLEPIVRQKLHLPAKQ